MLTLWKDNTRRYETKHISEYLPCNVLSLSIYLGVMFDPFHLNMFQIRFDSFTFWSCDTNNVIGIYTNWTVLRMKEYQDTKSGFARYKICSTFM